MRHLASPLFWALHDALPADARALADKNFAFPKSNPRHRSLHFKRISDLWSVRVGDHYRALGTEVKEGIYWIWISTHAEDDRIAGLSVARANSPPAPCSPLGH